MWIIHFEDIFLLLKFTVPHDSADKFVRNLGYDQPVYIYKA